MSENKIVSVMNRSRSTVVYTLDEPAVRRQFAPSQTLKIPVEELEALTYKPGGKNLLDRFLQIQDEEVVSNFLGTVEPEYWLKEENVIKLLQTGTVDELTDCINFAPTGVRDLIKKYAYELPVNDTRKCKVIKDLMGFDVMEALRHKAEVEADEPTVETTKPERLVKKTDETPKRKAATPNYKVVEPAK